VIHFAESILRWYDQYQRLLPWRALPGKSANPYHVLLSEIMLQQTTVATVKDYFYRFTTQWPTVESLARADLHQIYHVWQGLGYYSRARNLHLCAQLLVKEYGGKIPEDPHKLIKLPGIGPYTSAAVAAIAFNQPSIPVDGNIIRVIARYHGIMTPLPQLKGEIEQWAHQQVVPKRSGDFAQALMDLGAMICRPHNPLCLDCPVHGTCQIYQNGDPKQIPAKATKKPKPIKMGTVFVYSNEKGQVQLRQRPKKGLLANLYEFPGTTWEVAQPLRINEAVLSNNFIKHTFTHFHLYLIVTTRVQPHLVDETCFWVWPDELSHYALPTLMKKVWLKALASHK
jgi:A/G-specific adenine glycosylase